MRKLTAETTPFEATAEFVAFTVTAETTTFVATAATTTFAATAGTAAFAVTDGTAVYTKKALNFFWKIFLICVHMCLFQHILSTYLLFFISK